MKIRFLGTHNAETIDFAYTCFTLDGELLFDCGSAASRLEIGEQTALQGIFITHGHYDHIKDIPAIGMNLYDDVYARKPLPIISLPATLQDIRKYLTDGQIYSDFFQKGVFTEIEAQFNVPLEFNGFTVTPIESLHKIPCTGYHVQKNGVCFYYTGDTQNGFAQNLVNSGLSCDILIAECTLKNSYKGTTAHLTPSQLSEELKIIQRHQGFYPAVFAVHRSAKMEETLLTELEELSKELGTEVFVPAEGTEIEF